jgi:hypothetical protein
LRCAIGFESKLPSKACEERDEPRGVVDDTAISDRERVRHRIVSSEIARRRGCFPRNAFCDVQR